MKSKKFIIFGAAAILALTPAIAGCANTVAASFRGVRQDATTHEGNVFTADYTAESLGFDDGTKHTDFNLDPVIKVSITGGTNSGKYYDTGSAIRLYYSESATITFETANENYIINSIKLTYASPVSSGKSCYLADCESDSTVEVNSTSKQFTIDGTGNHLRISNFKVVYTQIAVQKYLTISSDSAYTMVGSSLQFNSDNDGFDETPTLTRTSSKPSVATINESGLLTPISMGTTKIKAYANTDEAESNEIEITVWPNNENDIDVTTAASISEFTGQNLTPYKYGFTGIISSKSGTKQMTLKELNSESTIIAYGITHASLAVGTKIHIFGNLQEYNSAPEFAGSIEYYTLHTVTFNPDNGESSSILNDVHSGALLEKPQDPTKDGFTFEGWYTSEDEEWDFANDTIIGDLVLTAKWVDNQLASVLSDLNNINTYFSLAYKFNSTSNNKQFNILPTHGASSDSNTAYTASTILEDIDLPSEIEVASLSTVYQGENNTLKFGKSGGSGSITFTSQETITHVTLIAKKYGSDNNFLKVNNQNGDALTSDFAEYNFVIPENGSKTITIATSTKRAYISEIRLYNKSMSITNDEIRFKAATDDFSDFVSAHSSIADYGIEISTSSKTKKYNYTDANSQIYSETKNGEKYQYQVISLGAALNNPARLDEVFTLKAYAVYNGETYYSENVKSYSVVNLVKAYYAKESTKDMITPLYDALVYLGKIN